MYFHLGAGEVLESEDVIGVFDLDITSSSHLTREFLTASEKRGEVISVSEDIPRTFILTEEKGQTRLYLCQPAPATLTKRAAAGLN